MKNHNKMIILMLITSAFSFSMPAAFSIGTGQHQFVQINPEDPDAFCNRCHGTGDDIKQELMSSGAGIYNGNQRIHNSLTCVSCHQIAQGFGMSMGDKTEHAARIPSCTECHNNVDYLGPTIGNVGNELNSSTEAHKSMGLDGDRACIGCHTTVQVYGSITYSYSGVK